MNQTSFKPIKFQYLACIQYLKHNLTNDIDKYVYTIELREVLLASLIKRFDQLIKDDDLYVISTFLDPKFGINAFPDDMKEKVKRCVKKQMLTKADDNTAITISTKVSNKEQERNNNYIIYSSTNNSTPTKLDQKDVTIDAYIEMLKTNDTKNPLLFWKKYEFTFLCLSELAKKYLSVSASSACVEMMFSISGHIFSLKRRSLGIQFLWIWFG